MNGFTVWTGVLLAMLVVTAVAVVQSKHQGRRLFVQLQELVTERDRLDVDWGRLQLEQGAWATQGRVEQFARERMKMRAPEAADTVIVFQ